MKPATIINTLLGAVLLAAAGLALEAFPQPFDPRSIVEDGVVGGGFWLEEVDGKPTQRIRHGFLLSKVPLALVRPGERILGLSTTSPPPKDTKLLEFRATIEKGMRYRIVKNEAGNPELVVAK